MKKTLLALAIATALPCMTFAADEETKKKDDDKSSGQLETIIVTANRRAERIRDVPISISTLKGEKLDAINASGADIRMLAARIPSVNVESSFGRAFPRFYMRGLGNTDFDLNASQPVSLVYDEIVQENPILKGFPVFDLDQIEVLRGPQGTLFGRNSPAGVIKFDSAKPTQNFEGYFNASLATYKTVNLEGAVNVPLDKSLAMRFSAQAQHRDDWVKNTLATAPTQGYEGYNDNAWRLQFLYQPSANFSTLVNFHGRDLKGSARVFRANIIKRGTNDLVDGFDESQVTLNGVNTQELESSGANVRVRWGLDNGMTLHSITGLEQVTVYSRGDIDGGTPTGPGVVPFQVETASGLPQHHQFTQEFRLESDPKAPVNWVGGLYYFDENFVIENFGYNATTHAQSSYARQEQANTAWAAFGSAQFTLSDAWKVRAGLRYTDDKKDYLLVRDPANPQTRNPHEHKVSWDLSSTYALNADTNVYGRVATGFRAPSIQGRSNIPSVAGSETVLSYEAGIKQDLFNRRARLSANVFHYTLKDIQLTAVGGQDNTNILLNANRARGQGAEIDFQANLTDAIQVSLGGSYNDTKIDDPNLSVPVCGNGCTVLDPLVPGTTRARIDGNPLPQAPKWVTNFTLRYQVPMAGGDFYVYTDWSYRSKINFFLYESTEFTGKSLLEGGLRVGYKWNNQEIALYGRNITNQIRVTGGIDFNNMTGFINEPRVWGVQYKTSF